MPNTTVIIPARYDSQRFLGKVLADDTGKPLIQHVYEGCAGAQSVNRIIVAADDQRIIDAVHRFGGEAVLTDPGHSNGTSRIAEVAASIDSETIVNVQGDEPDIQPKIIDAAVQSLADHPDCVMSTIASPFTENEDPADPNIVKVVMDQSGRALYFTRALVPFDREHSGSSAPLKHFGMYVYRRDFLLKYITLSPTPLEQTERLEQLRVLEHGEHIAVTIADVRWHGIDTPQQYAEFVERWRLA